MPVGPYETFAECVRAQMEIYRKKNPDWSEERLRKAAGGTCYEIEQRAGGFFSFNAAFTTFEEKGKRYAKIRVIDADVNRDPEPWGVTREAIQDALDGLKYARVAAPPAEGESYDFIFPSVMKSHAGFWGNVGPVVDYDIEDDGAASAVVEVLKDADWKRMKTGELKAVSPGIWAQERYYDEQGNEIDTRFVFDHILFVPSHMTPCYPDTGVVALCEGDPSRCTFAAAMSCYLQGHAKHDKMWGASRESTQGPEKKAGIMSPKGSDRKVIPSVKLGGIEMLKDDKDPCEHAAEEQLKAVETKVAGFEQKFGTLEKKFTDFDKKFDSFFAAFKPAATDDKKTETAPEVKELQAKVAAMEQEKHVALVLAVAIARVAAGLAKELGPETERVKKLSNETLNELLVDAQTVEKIKPTFEPEPLARFGGGVSMPVVSESKELRSMLENMRVGMFGYRRGLPEKFDQVN